MKGLILKDIYQLKSYSRVFIALVIFCVLLAFTEENTIFLMLYPGVLMGMMPITMYAYDEKAKFHSFLAALPVRKQDYVTAKYILGIGLNLLTCLLTGTIQAIHMISNGTFVFSELLMVIALAFAVGLVAPAVVLPFIFALGTEKGRFVNIIVVAISVSVISIFMNMGSDFQILMDAQQMILIALAAALLIYTLSWWITTRIYDKKEY